MEGLSELAKLFKDAPPQPPEAVYPVCASWTDGVDSTCKMCTGSKYLNKHCYDLETGKIPKHKCSVCKKALHAPICTAFEGSEECPICVTCHQATNSEHPRWSDGVGGGDNNKRGGGSSNAGRKREGKNTSTRKKRRTGSSPRHDDGTDTNKEDKNEVLPAVAPVFKKKPKASVATTFDRNHSTMRRFWQYTKNLAKPNWLKKGHEWSNEELFAVTPDEIVRYMMSGRTMILMQITKLLTQHFVVTKHYKVSKKEFPLLCPTKTCLGVLSAQKETQRDLNRYRSA